MKSILTFRHSLAYAIKILLGVSQLFTFNHAFADDSASPLIFTVMPILRRDISESRIRPLATYLIAALDKKAKVVIPLSYCDTYNRASSLETDLLIAPTSWAPYLVSTLNYQPLLVSERKQTLYLLSTKHNPAPIAEELAEKSIGIHSPSSDIASLAQQHIRSKLPIESKDKKFITYESSDRVLLALLNNEIDVAAVPAISFNNLSSLIRADLNATRIEGSLPALIILASPKLNQEDLHKIQLAGISIPDSIMTTMHFRFSFTAANHDTIRNIDQIKHNSAPTQLCHSDVRSF